MIIRGRCGTRPRADQSPLRMVAKRASAAQKNRAARGDRNGARKIDRMQNITYGPTENKPVDQALMFIGSDGRTRIRHPGRGGWRFAKPSELAMLRQPTIAVGGYRGDE